MAESKTPKHMDAMKQRRLIGWLGLALPAFVLIVSAILQPTGGWRMLPSISAYYYTSAGVVFVGVQFALALFLWNYGGYDGDRADRILGRVAGIAAVCAAGFPTSVPEGFPVPPWRHAWMTWAHYGAAVTLLGTFFFFSFWVFRRSAVTKDKRPIDKIRRDRLYLGCAVAILLSMAWAGTSLWTKAPIFIPEAIALVAFAVSWLVKGESRIVPYRYRPAANDNR